METSLIDSLKKQSKLSQHIQRLDKLQGKLDFFLYLSKIKEQNKAQYLFKKWEPALSDAPDTPTEQNKLNVLNNNFQFIGIKKGKYKNYFEFVDTANKTEDFYTDFKYLYFEINSLNQTYLTSKLPYFYQWSIDPFQIKKEVPYKPYLIERTADSFNSFYSYIVQDLNHPFFPFFYFTGRVVVLNSGTLLYEYFDDQGIYGIRDALYMSPVKPNIDFPLGELGKGMLEQLDCWNSLVGFYPIVGDLNSLGTFTGYSTTSLYNSKKRFYLYQRNKGSAFLSEYLPSKESKSLAEHISLIEKNEPNLIIIPELGESTLGINTSTQETLTFINVET